MVLKEFSMDVPGRGRADVSFYLHFDNMTARVAEIKVHTDFEAGYPHKLQLKQDSGQWKLFVEHPMKANGEISVVPEFLNDDLSNAIAARLVEIRDNA